MMKMFKFASEASPDKVRMQIWESRGGEERQNRGLGCISEVAQVKKNQTKREVFQTKPNQTRKEEVFQIGRWRICAELQSVWNDMLTLK